jgi:hypothetical protein
MKTTIYFFLVISLLYSINIQAQKLKVPPKSEEKPFNSLFKAIYLPYLLNIN